MSNSPAKFEGDGEGVERAAPSLDAVPELDDPDDPSAGVQGIIVQAIESFRAELFIGPLPSPDILKNYDNVLPGLADRIVVMAENQSRHRIEIETNHVRDSNRRSLLG